MREHARYDDEHPKIALEVVNKWLADPRFGIIKQPLQTIQVRMKEFARQAGKP
jgi:hypothetical protein